MDNDNSGVGSQNSFFSNVVSDDKKDDIEDGTEDDAEEDADDDSNFNKRSIPKDYRRNGLNLLKHGQIGSPAFYDTVGKIIGNRISWKANHAIAEYIVTEQKFPEEGEIEKIVNTVQEWAQKKVVINKDCHGYTLLNKNEIKEAKQTCINECEKQKNKYLRRKNERERITRAIELCGNTFAEDISGVDYFPKVTLKFPQLKMRNFFNNQIIQTHLNKMEVIPEDEMYYLDAWAKTKYGSQIKKNDLTIQTKSYEEKTLDWEWESAQTHTVKVNEYIRNIIWQNKNLSLKNKLIIMYKYAWENIKENDGLRYEIAKNIAKVRGMLIKICEQRKNYNLVECIENNFSESGNLKVYLIFGLGISKATYIGKYIKKRLPKEMYDQLENIKEEKTTWKEFYATFGESEDENNEEPETQEIKEENTEENKERQIEKVEEKDVKLEIPSETKKKKKKKKRKTLKEIRRQRKRRKRNKRKS